MRHVKKGFTRRKIKPMDRFLSKVLKTSNCWLWTACKTQSGYGVFSLNRKYIRAHRASWVLHFGELPKSDGFNGICVLHHCDVRHCVNPNHLYLGTGKENMKDRTCRDRLPKGSAHANSKLVEQDIIDIRRDIRQGVIVAKKYNITPAQISNIRLRKQWGHVQ